jgi:hypothetical protein
MYTMFCTVQATCGGNSHYATALPRISYCSIHTIFMIKIDVLAYRSTNKGSGKVPKDETSISMILKGIRREFEHVMRS